ncbi:MAG: lytic murein transglycosylase [Candidatus Paceibacterota bacterium]
MQGTLSNKIKEMTNLRDNLLEEKELLALQKDDAIRLAQFQAEQKKSVLSTKSQKDVILEETRGKEATYQDLYVKTKQSADEIRSRIFRLLGGGEMTFEQAYNYAKYSNGLTGIRPAFLLAILQQESALGKNVGKCNYRDAMAPGPPTSRRDDITPFLQITAELGLDPDQTLVSCAISTDGAYGGAMGPSQFIPTTWMYYKDRVSKLTGNSPASPWNNGDAFVATGLYLSDAMNSCSQYSGTDQERCAAARYYAGGNWQTHLWTYGERVIARAAQFEADIEIIR